MVFNINAAIIIFFLAGLFATLGRCQQLLAQESATSTESKAQIVPSPSVREHLHRVQTSFSQTDDKLWQRFAFVAVISDIRPLKPSDKLIGELANGETSVVVLQIREIGERNSVDLEDATEIAIPVGKQANFWKQWQSEKAEILLEYNRIGKRVFVQKFGC